MSRQKLKDVFNAAISNLASNYRCDGEVNGELVAYDLEELFKPYVLSCIDHEVLPDSEELVALSNEDYWKRRAIAAENRLRVLQDAISYVQELAHEITQVKTE